MSKAYIVCRDVRKRFGEHEVLKGVSTEFQTGLVTVIIGASGSGKTIVAALSAVIAIDAGWQCALMAPTEILAEQHFAKLVGWLEPILAPLGKQVAWAAPLPCR